MYSVKAFRKNRRLEDHLFTLNGICSQRKSSKLKTYKLSLIYRKHLIEFGVKVFFTYCGKMWYRGKYGVS